MKKILLTTSLSLLLLSGCSKDYNMEDYKIVLLENNHKSYNEQIKEIPEMKKILEDKYNIDLTIERNNANSDILQNKVIQNDKNKNVFAVYDKDNPNKLIGVTYGNFDDLDDFSFHIHQSVLDQKTIYQKEGLKFVYSHNDNNTEFQQREKNSINDTIMITDSRIVDEYTIAMKNYHRNKDDDDFFVFDENNNLLLQYNIDNPIYYTDKNQEINIDATLLKNIFKIKNDNDMIAIYFYESTDTQYSMLKKYQSDRNMPIHFIFTSASTDTQEAIVSYLKESFEIEGNEMVIINGLKNIKDYKKENKFKDEYEIKNFLSESK